MAVKNACGVLPAGLLPLGCNGQEFQRFKLKQIFAVYLCDIYPIPRVGSMDDPHPFFIEDYGKPVAGSLGKYKIYFLNFK